MCEFAFLSFLNIVKQTIPAQALKNKPPMPLTKFAYGYSARCNAARCSKARAIKEFA